MQVKNKLWSKWEHIIIYFIFADLILPPLSVQHFSLFSRQSLASRETFSLVEVSVVVSGGSGSDSSSQELDSKDVWTRLFFDGAAYKNEKRMDTKTSSMWSFCYRSQFDYHTVQHLKMKTIFITWMTLIINNWPQSFHFLWTPKKLNTWAEGYSHKIFNPLTL